MGQRANLVIVRNGDWSLYYDHWCANRLDDELFWGPELAIEFIRQREPVAEPEGWLDTIWCEGAAIVDVGRSVLTWFGGEDVLYDVPQRRAHLELMAHQWPGWDIRWAHEGILSIADELGLPRAEFRGRPRDADAQSTRPRLARNDEFPDFNQVATSVRLEDGELLVARLCGTTDALHAGPALLEPLLAHGSRDPLRWNPFPWGGVHVDRGQRTIDVWWAGTTYDLVDHMRAAWPGWTVGWHRDRYERQVELADGRIVLPAPGNPHRSVLEFLASQVFHEARNPAAEIAPLLASQGHNVDYINPATAISRGSAGDPDHKRAILAALARSLTSTA